MNKELEDQIKKIAIDNCLNYEIKGGEIVVTKPKVKYYYGKKNYIIKEAIICDAAYSYDLEGVEHSKNFTNKPDCYRHMIEYAYSNGMNIEITRIGDWGVILDPTFAGWIDNMDHPENVYRIAPKRELLFENTIGEEFFNKEDVGYWFLKDNHTLHSMPLHLIAEGDYKESENVSQIYKTKESRDKALEEYKEGQKVIFTNSIGEKFFNYKNVVYWFIKKDMRILSDTFETVADSLESDSEESEIYRTKESAEKQLSIYKESLKPKYRPFKIEELTDELMCKSVRSLETAPKLLGSFTLSQFTLDGLFLECTFLNGSPVGVKIN